MTARPAIAVLLALLALGVASAPAAATDLFPKGPSGLAFYTPKSIGKGEHGSVIWARKVKSPLADASRTWKVLYRSKNSRGKTIGVSGTLILPRGRAPKGGWPVLSWAHGTSGIADRCAPSRDPSGPYTSYVDKQQNAWLRQGYAIASTDYEGLGTPGVHPYLVGVSAGRGVLDIARAAQSLDGRVSSRLVVAGHSQGGHAALWAAGLAAKWTPELKFRGVAAFAPPSNLGALAAILPTLTTPSALSGLAGMIVTGLSATYPQLDAKAIVSDEGLARLPDTKTKCLDKLFAPESLGGLAPAALIRPGANLNLLNRLIDAQNPDLKIGAPVLILQGEADTTVPVSLTNQLDTQLKARKGNRITYVTYPEVDHVGVVNAADKRMRAFLKARR